EPGTGIIHKPRAGIATLVAAVPASHGFDNQGEPYVDMNDNGVHDAGEPYIDYNGNGKYDGPDGRAKDHMVWKAFRVIWSGEAAVSPAGQGTVHDSFLSRSGNTVTLKLFDRNFNALASERQS